MPSHSFVRRSLTVASLAMAGLAGACSPLSIFDALAPADAAAAKIHADLAYGQGPRQQLDVYVPGAAKAPAAVVVVFYGGSWNSGRKENYSFLGKALAARGFIAMIADYRLVPAVRFPEFIEDCAQATHWAHTHAATYGGDPKRVFLLGHSAGAYNAAMVALDGRYLAALGSSVAIVRGAALLAGPYDFLPLDATSTIAAFGQARNLTETQPVAFAGRAAPPMFLATGEDDTTVKPRNTRALAGRLQAAGSPVTVKTYPGIGHIGILLALSVPFRGQAPVLDDISAFIGGER